MQSESYPNKIAAVYPDAAAAEAAVKGLEDAALEHVTVARLAPGDTDFDQAIEPETRGLKLRENVLASLVKDALDAGYYSAIVHAANNATQRHTRAVIDETLAEETAQTQGGELLIDSTLQRRQGSRRWILQAQLSRNEMWYVITTNEV